MRSRAVEMSGITALDIFWDTNPEQQWNYARHHLLIKLYCATIGFRFVFLNRESFFLGKF